jgi:flagellar biosynthesis protein FliR
VIFGWTLSLILRIWSFPFLISVFSAVEVPRSVRALLAGLRLWLKRLRLWLWQNNGFFGEAETIL